MNKDELSKLNEIFELYSEIGIVYFFGSKASGEDGEMSDYDFAVFLDLEKSAKSKIFDIKFELQDRVGRALKTDKVDIVILNTTESPELKYNIIKNGKIIFEREPFRILTEPKILNEYFDFYEMLLRNNLTKA